MHYLLEIIMPPTDDIEGQIEKIMKPFSKNSSYDKDEDFSGHPFWDWYQIGGRFAGSKFEAKLDKDKLEMFWEKMKDMKITVSGLVWGKQEISPASQIPLVDGLWNEMFPDSGIEACPFFLHSNRNSTPLIGDIATLADTPKTMTASKVIIACPNYKDEIRSVNMFSDSIWNGVSHEKTSWDKTINGALSMHMNKIKSYKDEARDRYTPKDDWLCVTIDYHS